MRRFDLLSGRPVLRWFAMILGAAALAGGVGAALRLHEGGAACAATSGHACAMPGAPKGAAQQADATDLPAGPVVVELSSEDCPACKQLEPVLREAREQCKSAGAELVRVDVESPSGGALAARLGVTGTPTLVMFDASHEEVARVVGSQPLADVRKALEQAYGVACAPVKGPTGG